VNDEDFLTREFEANRPHLRAVAYRILGNGQDVEDALQDAWLRISTSDGEQIENVTGWLTTVVARICLNTLRTRHRRPSESLEASSGVERLVASTARTPEEQAVVADSVGVALLVVLELLSPAERISFVLHDLFSVPFEEIAEILGKSPDACRQLASRARRRVRTADEPATQGQLQREVVDAFLHASRGGDFQTLLSLLSPDVELVSDAAAIAIGAPERKDGPFDVATRFSGGAQSARLALLDGRAGLVWAQGRTPTIAFDFTLVDGRVTRIDMIGDTDVLSEIQIDYVHRTNPNVTSDSTL
jgi:RNA polymerase sigma factor (sigma-70 family)